MVVMSLHRHLLGEIKVEIQTSLNGLTSLICSRHMNREVGAPQRQLVFPERTPVMLVGSPKANSLHRRGLLHKPLQEVPGCVADGRQAGVRRLKHSK
jgi:hypothetical protein